MSRQKRARVLGLKEFPYPWYHSETNTIRVPLVDESEPDRIHLLVLYPEDVIALGARIDRANAQRGRSFE